MGGKAYSTEPVKVRKVTTPFREIVTPIPAPDSVPILESIRRYEPYSTAGQPPILWDHAEGFQVYDKYGNKWLDWTSGVLVANAGHGRMEIRRAIVDAVEKSLLFSYFPNEYEAKLVKKIAELAPEGLDRVFLLVTGEHHQSFKAVWKESRRREQKGDYFIHWGIPRKDIRGTDDWRISKPETVDRVYRSEYVCATLS